MSGFAGLMHEIVWSKLLAVLIGTTAHAQAAVLVVYMGGIALGSFVFGRQSDRGARPLRTYMVLEFAIAAYCLLLPFLLAVAADAYVPLAGLVFESSRLKFGLRFTLALLTILLPAVMMGGTLPLLARYMIGNPADTRRNVALLYAVNNFGAVAGAIFAGFVTLPIFGVYASLVAASTMNVIAAVLVWPMTRTEAAAARASSAAVEAEPGPEPSMSYPQSAYSMALFALVLSGFAAMGYEVVFIRIISLAFGATTYSFTVMLVSFIAGIGLGSLVLMQVHVRRPLWLFGLTQLVVVVAFVLSTPLMARLPYLVGLVRIAALESEAGFIPYQVGKALLCLGVLLVPTACLGAGFPLVAAIQARNPGRIGSRVGLTYACNTLGNVLGILATTLVLLPNFGLLGSFHINIALSALAGTLVLAVASEAAVRLRVAAMAITALAVAGYVTAGTDWPTPLVYGWRHMDMASGPSPQLDEASRARHPASSFEAWKNSYVVRPSKARTVYLHEEAHANVVAVRDNAGTWLIVNTKTDASNRGLDLETQLLLAHAPMFMNPDARSVLVVGYGSGITLGSVLRHPVERADVVEISDAVLELDFVFAADNYNVLEDSRTHVYIDDAQSFLRTVPRHYDVIISEPSNPWIAGIAGLFTVEFFEVAADRLEPGGIFALWFHEYDQNDEGIQLILRTLASVFPHILLFHEQSYSDVVAVASVDPFALNPADLEDRFDEPAVRNDLARIGIPNLAALLSHHAVASRRVPAILGQGPLNSVTHQLLEHIAIRAKFFGESSGMVEQSNPLLREMPEADVLLDGYTYFRASVEDPIRRAELDDAARHMSSRGEYRIEVTRSFAARSELASRAHDPSARPSRGGRPAADTAGAHEAVYWARRAAAQGDWETAARFSRRRLDLDPDDSASALSLARVLIRLGDREGARRVVDRGLEHTPGHHELRELQESLL